METAEAGTSIERTSTLAFLACMMPLTLGFLTLKAPLSQETTAGKGACTFAFPAPFGATTERPPSKEALMALEIEAQPSRSASPGPVEPAPVSAAALPQYTISPPSSVTARARTV